MAVKYSAPTTAFALPPELIELKEHAKNIVERECFPLEAKFLSNQWLDEGPKPGATEGQVDGSLPAEDWARLKQISQDAGLYAVGLPEEYGGEGYGALGEVVVAEQLNRSVVKLPRSGAMMPLLHGTDAQKEEFLMPSIRGEKRFVFAQSEPGAGSDPGNSMRTTAKPDGDGWRINGQKMWISGVEDADYMLVLTVTDPEKRQRGGMTMFIVDRDSPGISWSPIETWLVRKAHQYLVTFDDVFVPGDRILGSEGYGFGLGQEWLAIQDRLTRGTLACGRLARGLEIATEWAKSRETFGAPLAERQAIQWMLVDVFMDLKTIRAIAYETAARYDAGEEVRHLAAMAKYMGGNYGHRSMDKIMQILGGMGETLEMPISTFYRELRHGRIGGGTDEIQRILMARAILKQGKKVWEA
ncbi:acyl-CoA dehydrogenase [Geodermatophilus amargosae]|uniref:Acyl-CoA dehydrogenase n=1 Tax=Geodermatophilus amargosae TaxID=1296565 RepID=A0A1I7D273_9ACTN|nr:acyl-CoA dehydrogenase family protein [Geodermatophilus amargosae]SFU05711.1 acyl-CoA dehydrogenase [Geodermatophilus amargosae]